MESSAVPRQVQDDPQPQILYPWGMNRSHQPSARFSLRTLLLILTYVAICCTTYLYANLWFGTLVVVATTVWLFATTLHAFHTQSRFALGFSLAGWSWIVFWFGFYAQTGPTTLKWRVPVWIYSAVTFYQEPREYLGSWNHKVYGRKHSLFDSGNLAVPDHLPPLIPSWENAMRLFVCVTALIVGIAGGCLLQLATRPRQQREPPMKANE